MQALTSMKTEGLNTNFLLLLVIKCMSFYIFFCVSTCENHCEGLD